MKSLCCVRPLATPWTAAYQAPPSMGASRQEYWSGCHFLLQCMKVKSLSRAQWTAAHQAPPSMGFSRQEHWSGAPLPSPAANADRVSVCCTCHFQSSSPFFVPFGLLSLQVSSVSNFHPDTGGEGGRLFRLTCSVVLRGGRNTANKYHWRVWGVLAVSGPHWVCPCSRRVCFPGLHCSGSRLFCWRAI